MDNIIELPAAIALTVIFLDDSLLANTRVS